MWLLKTGNCLIQVAAKAGVTVYVHELLETHLYIHQIFET